MCLENKLISKVKSSEAETSKELTVLLQELYVIVEAYWKPKLTEEMHPVEMMNVIDQSFRSWDLMVTELEEDEYLFAGLLEEYSYKKAFTKSKAGDVFKRIKN